MLPAHGSGTKFYLIPPVQNTKRTECTRTSIFHYLQKNIAVLQKRNVWRHKEQKQNYIAETAQNDPVRVSSVAVIKIKKIKGGGASSEVPMKFVSTLE